MVNISEISFVPFFNLNGFFSTKVNFSPLFGALKPFPNSNLISFFLVVPFSTNLNVAARVAFVLLDPNFNACPIGNASSEIVLYTPPLLT